MERYLATSGEFEYTLNLSAESRPGVDPIEQFLAFDKKGHCQYLCFGIGDDASKSGHSGPSRRRLSH